MSTMLLGGNWIDGLLDLYRYRLEDWQYISTIFLTSYSSFYGLMKGFLLVGRGGIIRFILR
jgi:hypothetical protein